MEAAVSAETNTQNSHGDPHPQLWEPEVSSMDSIHNYSPVV